MLLNIGLIIIGFVLLIKGADLLVDGSSNIAKRFHIPEIIIGLTIVSIGTSMPELFVSITSALNNSADMAIGNVVGSNVCNLLLILGLSSIIKPVLFQKQTKKIEIPMCLAFTLLFLTLCNIGKNITRLDAILLISGFLIFILYTIFSGIKSVQNQAKDEKKVDNKYKKGFMIKSLLYVVIGIVALKYGGDFVVDGAVYIANKFNVSEIIISVTILAIGTSLPELVTSVTAAIKGNSDIAIGNILGSNIFNMLLIIGVSGLIQPITYNPIYNIHMAILIFGTCLLVIFPFIPPKNVMSRANGIIYVLLYAIYMGILLVI